LFPIFTEILVLFLFSTTNEFC